jgi:hypothetical protein
MGADLMYTERQVDRLDEDNVHFFDLCKRPENGYRIGEVGLFTSNKLSSVTVVRGCNACCQFKST